VGQSDALSGVAAVLGATDADQVALPRRWVEALLAPRTFTVATDDGIARDAEQAAELVGMSSSRLRRLATAGLLPGSYREPGSRGRWRFPLSSLRALQRAMASAGGEGQS